MFTYLKFLRHTKIPPISCLLINYEKNRKSYLNYFSSIFEILCRKKGYMVRYHNNFIFKDAGIHFVLVSQSLFCILLEKLIPSDLTKTFPNNDCVELGRLCHCTGLIKNVKFLAEDAYVRAKVSNIYK